jgi:hypothetical protein
MGRLVVEDELSFGVTVAVVGVAAVGVAAMVAVDWFPELLWRLGLVGLRLDPKPRFLNREFIRSMCFIISQA